MIKRLKVAFKGFKNPDLVEEAGKDFLTGALLRKAFLKASEREFQRAVRCGQLLTLIFIDLDGLKEINDRYGHEKGDHHLRIFAQTVFAEIRKFELLARWGGDEFVLLLSADDKTAEKVVRRIYISFPFFSYGISVWGKEENFYQTLKKADENMYKMKKTRR